MLGNVPYLMPTDNELQFQFTRQFSECERAMRAFAFSLVPNRADVDDIVQETLKALWKKFDEYDPARPFLPWANRFVYRQVLIHRRSRAKDKMFLFGEETLETLVSNESNSLEQDKAMRDALDRCLQTLSPKNRELIEQRYQSKGTLQDYAAGAGLTPNSLYKTLQRIRRALHDCISQRLAKEGIRV